MANAQMTELRKLSKADLIKRLDELETLLDKFYTLPKEKLENVGSKRNFKLEYARIKTILSLI